MKIGKTRRRAAQLAAAILVCLLLSATGFASGPVSAARSSSQVYLNDSRVSITGCNIGGNNYYRLRDLAAAFRGTSSSFDVTWNGETKQVEVLTGRDYTGEAESGGLSWWGASQATLSSSRLVVDGRPVDVTAYNIDGSNYYKLRDLSEALSFAVCWEQERDSILLYTLDEHTSLAESSGGAARPMTASGSTARWSHTNLSYLYEDGGSSFYVVEAGSAEGVVTVDTYDKETLALLEKRSVPMELDIFGGFYAGEACSYMVFGQSNTEEDNRKEVVRVVKYDKSFNRLAAASITGGESFTIIPFDAGSLRMAESGGELTIHTARKRHTTEDGLNHQSQLTIILNTDTMKVKNTMGRYQDNHVSHSFNQFVQYDGGRTVLVDHGDAYPRSVVLNVSSGGSYTETDLLKIPGEVGANCTGVTVGGLEVSGSHYLVAVNTIDHSKVTAYDSFEMAGLDRDERDVVLLACQKSGRSVSRVELTDYVDRGLLGSTPYLVKLPEDRFAVLWEEFAYTGQSTEDRGVRYVVVDGAGRPQTEVQSLPGARLSADCQPVYSGGEIMWYVNAQGGRLFYRTGRI